MKGSLQKFLLTKHRMIQCTVDTDQPWNPRARRMLWQALFLLTYMGWLPARYISLFFWLKNVMVLGEFCRLGATSWSLQNVQLSMAKLCESQWCFKALCIHGHGITWMCTFRDTGNVMLTYLQRCSNLCMCWMIFSSVTQVALMISIVISLASNKKIFQTFCHRQILTKK